MTLSSPPGAGPRSDASAEGPGKAAPGREAHASSSSASSLASSAASPVSTALPGDEFTSVSRLDAWVGKLPPWLQPWCGSAQLGTALRISAGMFGWLAFLLFLSSYRPLFGGTGWWPLVVAVIAISIDIGLRLRHHSTEMPAIPIWWPGPAHVCGLLGAWMVVLAVITVFVPSARRELRMYDHGWTRGLQPLRGGIGLAQRQDFYRAETGPRLLGEAGALNRRIQALNNAPLEYPPVQWRSDYALVYAALRAQGYSDEKILTMPCGRRILLGTLCAEAVPPYWLPLADTWIFRMMLPEPAGGRRLGWLRPGFMRGQIAQLLARPEQISAQTLEALLFISGYIPEVFNEDGSARLLKIKSRRALLPAPGQTRPTREQQLESAYYQELAQAREKLSAFLGAGRPDSAALLVQAHYPPGWTTATRETARDSAARFIALAGQRVEWMEAAEAIQPNKPGTGPGSAADTEGPLAGAQPNTDSLPATQPPAPANVPTAEPLKPDIVLYFTLRSSLFDKVRYESATTATASGGAGDMPLTTEQENRPELVINDHDELITVEQKRKTVIRYNHSATLQEGEGPARLPILLVRLERDGQEHELSLPIFQRINLDYARAALQAMDTPPPLTATLSAVLNDYTTQTLLSPWRLDHPASSTENDWQSARWDRTPAP